MRAVIHRCHVVLVMWSALRLTSCVKESSLKCLDGNPVSFECPCCPLEIDSCKFKKLFHEEAIVHNGLVNDNKFELSRNLTQVVLRKCSEDDEGTYLWICDRCNVTTTFHLEVESTEPHQEKTWNKMLLLLILIPVVVIVITVISLLFIKKRETVKRPVGYTSQEPGARSAPQERAQLFPERQPAILS